MYVKIEITYVTHVFIILFLNILSQHIFGKVETMSPKINLNKLKKDTKS